ncbi:MAG TPA: pyridoxine 5'-phosphate synthase [Planctomycetaceae bacterium]|nr:pyridoxine 5'-phosphate synthase [Planctomycetaceae bacterium]
MDVAVTMLAPQPYEMGRSAVAMTQLSVNLNKIALIRNSRGGQLPSVTRAAELCLAAGADGITVHPRPDQRHIRPSDVDALKSMLQVEFNIEGNPFNRPFMELIRRIRPTQLTMVPDAPSQLTSDHGWNLKLDAMRLRPLIQEFSRLGIRVSLFIDPVPEAMADAKELGAHRVELYTGPYAHDFAAGRPEGALEQYAAAAQAALDAGLEINAGHDLSLQNLGLFLDRVPGVAEVSIGHALISDALEVGLSSAVYHYAAICHQPR